MRWPTIGPTARFMRSHRSRCYPKLSNGSGSASSGPTLEEPILVPGADTATRNSSMTDSSENGPLLTGQRDALASPFRPVSPPCLVHQWLTDNLPEVVLNTITEARASSTRRLYALKWSVFSSWCSARNLDPQLCRVIDVLSFLQELLDTGRSPSTLKVYVSAIACILLSLCPVNHWGKMT